MRVNYKQLISGWHRKAEEQDDIFSPFVFEYLAFIAIIKTQQFRVNGNDREGIQKLKMSDEIKKEYLKIIGKNKQLKSDWQIIINELNQHRLGTYTNDPFNSAETKWWNCPHMELNQKTAEEKSKLAGTVFGFDDWENMVEFWYSIRNNLFHGTKDPHIERDQLLIEYGYKTLRPLVQHLIQICFG